MTDWIELRITPEQLGGLLAGDVVRIDLPDADACDSISVVFLRLDGKIATSD